MIRLSRIARSSQHTGLCPSVVAEFRQIRAGEAMRHERIIKVPARGLCGNPRAALRTDFSSQATVLSQLRGVWWKQQEVNRRISSLA